MYIALDDLILTKDLPTTGGSLMLKGYYSPFDAEVATRLTGAGHEITCKAAVGEFACDLLGETNFMGPTVDVDGNLCGGDIMVLMNNDAEAVVGLDVNGTPRRSAAVSNHICLKTSYGIVSRYGTIPLACSGESVYVTGVTSATCQDVLESIAGHDPKDGTSLPQERCVAAATPGEVPATVGVCRSLVEAAGPDVQARIQKVIAKLEARGVRVEWVDDSMLLAAKPAWNILMPAELCNNVSRYDGVKYGYRSQDYETIDELYTNSRTEAFGDVLKTVILFGSDVLFTHNYLAKYDRAMRMRRLVVERFQELFAQYDALLMPACSKLAFTPADVEADKFIAFQENLFTAPASISGLPALVAMGVQFMGPHGSDANLLRLSASLGACAWKEV
ncbi:MAG: hypothetical protein IJH83_01205 [Coriobacteriales bacterium]|nr:hypothetical protein [Coriobacteriales bacterium]